MRTTPRVRAYIATIEMGARQYVPGLGRFLEVDPVNGGSCNDYDYVCGDPVNSFDLTGTFLCGSVKACIRRMSPGPATTQGDASSTLNADATETLDDWLGYFQHGAETFGTVASGVTVGGLILGSLGCGLPCYELAAVGAGLATGASAVDAVFTCARDFMSMGCLQASGIAVAGAVIPPVAVGFYARAWVGPAANTAVDAVGRALGF